MEKKDFIIQNLLAVLLFGLIGFILVSLSFLVISTIINFGGISEFCERNPFGDGLIMVLFLFYALYIFFVFMYIKESVIENYKKLYTNNK